MKYKITAIQDTPTSTGKSKKTVSITDEANASYEKIGVWSDFPNYANLAVDQTVEGEVKTSPDGKWRNLVPLPTGTTPGGANRGQSGGFIAKAMEKKEAGIEKAQENKNESIKIASTFGKAVDCAIAEYNKDATNLDTLEELIRKWRKILWFEFDNHNEYPPFIK